jgi:integrase
MRQNGARVHGLYRHRNKWRIVLSGRGGRQEVVSFSTEAEARTHKAALLKQIAGRTDRNALATAKGFGAWCVQQTWIRSNPLADVTPIGQRNRGKKQLRIDEARKLVDLCVKKANEGDEAAVAVLTAFLLGMRASEVTDRVVRDLNDDGRLLWIEVGKTKRSRRTLEVPALLRPYLLALAKDCAPGEPLISRTLSPRGGKRDRFWLLYQLQQLCEEAEVPVVCAHSLRGLHATLATEAGATSHVVGLEPPRCYSLVPESRQQRRFRRAQTYP